MVRFSIITKTGQLRVLKLYHFPRNSLNGLVRLKFPVLSLGCSAEAASLGGPRNEWGKMKAPRHFTEAGFFMCPSGNFNVGENFRILNNG